MSGVFAVEITAYDPAIAGTRLLTFASQGFCSAPGDTPANTHFDPRLIEAGNFARFIVDALLTDGRSRVGIGEVVLNNADGGLDALNTYGLDGRSFVIRRGRIGAAYPSAWETVLTGTMEQAEFTWDAVRVLIRDRQAEVADQAYQPMKFAGTNALPDGVEGVTSDLKGKPKPRLHGKVRNVSPPMVNTSKLTFQVSDKQIASVDAVYVGGVSISAGTARADLAALQAATVSAGTFDYSLGSGSEGAYFRLGTTPDNAVTCDATAGATTADRTVAQIAEQVLLDAGVAGGDISASAVAALDAKNSAVVGYWTGTEENTVGQVLDAVLAAVGAFWATSSLGVFTFGRLEAPAGAAARTVSPYQILDGGQAVERIKAKGDDKGLPVWRVVLSYRRNWTVQSGADVFEAANARRPVLEQPYATVVSEDAAVKTVNLLSPEKKAVSLIDDAAAAQAEADRIQDLYGVKRDFIRVQLSADELTAGAPELGEVCELSADRFDWAAGKKFAVTGVIYEFSGNTMTLELWG